LARTLDPDHAQKPDDTDPNDLETINVYAVVFFRSTVQLDRWLSSVLVAEVAQVRAYPQHAPLLALTFLLSGGRWINAETGTRSDVPHNMIYPLKDTGRISTS
jgi:hypothetical protein